jgi:hypothetical protein
MQAKTGLMAILVMAALVVQVSAPSASAQPKPPINQGQPPAGFNDNFNRPPPPGNAAAEGFTVLLICFGGFVGFVLLGALGLGIVLLLVWYQKFEDQEGRISASRRPRARG